MSWSYSGDPSSSDRDALRFLVGDTDTSDQQLSNEELAYLLTEHGAVRPAGIAACRAMIGKYARLVDQSTGSIRISYSQRIKHYQFLLGEIRRGRLVAPYAGGISVSDAETVNEDTDRAAPTFSVGMHDNPTDYDERTDS